MYSDIRQAFEAYKQQVRDYLGWSARTAKKYGINDPGKCKPMRDFGGGDWDTIQQLSHGLEVARKILGITSQEEKKIFRKIKAEINRPVRT